MDAKIYLDQAGRYYKAEKPKDSGDAVFNVATEEMFQYLTEVPITLVEYHAILLKKDVPNDPQIKEINEVNAARIADFNESGSTKSISSN